MCFTNSKRAHIYSQTRVDGTCVTLTTPQKFGAGFPRISASLTQSELRRSDGRNSALGSGAIMTHGIILTHQQPTIIEMTIFTYIYLSKYGIRHATTTLLTKYKTVTLDPQKFGITEIRRCRNSGVSDVKSANTACGESAIYTQVTKIDTEMLYIRNYLSVVFACHKTVWVSHGASSKDSVVRLRLIAGGHQELCRKGGDDLNGVLD